MARKPIESFPHWKVGGSFANVALLALLLRFYGIAFVFALIGSVLLMSAVVARRRDAESSKHA